MSDPFEIRPSDSPLLHAVSRWTIGPGPQWACPDGLWDLLVYRGSMGSFLLLTGQTTKSVPLPFQPGDEVLTLSFKASTYLTHGSAASRVDRADSLSKSGHHFELGSDRLEIPRFDNAEDLVTALERRGLVATDDVVAAYLAGRPLATSTRTLQRHFLFATGLAPRAFHAMERAHQAVVWLHEGRPASVVAMEAGYSDQAHLTRSLKRLVGRTPSQIQADSSWPPSTRPNLVFAPFT